MIITSFTQSSAPLIKMNIISMLKDTMVSIVKCCQFPTCSTYCFISDLVFESYEEADSFVRQYEVESGYRHIRKKSRTTTANGK